MSTGETYIQVCSDSGATEKFAEKFAQNLNGGEIIELIGDVGAGKTTFVRGLARGLGAKDKVSSPTFTVEQIYRGRLNIHHFDFYRLSQPGLVAHELQEALEAPNSLVAIEWAETVRDVLPQGHTTILFEVDSETSRKLTISGALQ